MTDPTSASPSELPAGMRPALTPIDLLASLCEIIAFAVLAFWGFGAWPFAWNLLFGIATPVVAILLWALFISPRAVLAVHPFIRAIAELLIFAAATAAFWAMGLTWIGLSYAVVAIAVGVISGRRRLA